jgi:hypothetical protein
MIGFLRSRALKNAAARSAAATPVDKPPPRAGEAPSAQPGEPPDGEQARPIEDAGPVEDALASPSEPTPERYEAQENEDGWSVHDRETSDTAEVYGYRLVKMNKSRAESLVEVLNRAEARRRGRNG